MLLQLQFTLLISPAGTMKNPKHNLLMDHLKFLINLLTKLRAERTWHCSSVSVTRILVGYVTIFPTETQITLLSLLMFPALVTESFPQSCMALLMIMTVMSCQRTERSANSSHGRRGLMPLVSACSCRISSSSLLWTSQPRSCLRADKEKRKKKIRWEVFCFCHSLAKMYYAVCFI